MWRVAGAGPERQIGHATQRHRDLYLQDLSISFDEKEFDVREEQIGQTMPTARVCLRMCQS